MNADEEACLRSLSFTEIHARESIIEPAVQDTGDWLLKSRDFQDWIQRKRLIEHRGFFWIQGNPGSGKSTLMKKVYSHIKARSRDPSSVIAAFFFNARGNEFEKSPTGLFRTLLHTLCQRVSTLRDLVLKAYVAKRRLLSPDWQWQFRELLEFLAAVVTSSVLGQRSLILFVDALDECDLTATQSVIHIFENLARSSFSEGTNVSICVSSRYWPQFRIQNCFTARVELENGGDIARYLQKHLESTRINEDLEFNATLRAEILDKAKGTFLWVVLVTRELLQANTAGATLRELRDIVQRVPVELGDFYQHQVQNTKSEDRERMLRLLQLVFYAQRSLSPTELRYALAFGCEAHASYAEWSQSSEYIRSDEQMEKRIREHSKGLVEIAELPRDTESPQETDVEQSKGSDHGYPQVSARPRKAVVQFIHQSVKDFLTADGFSFLRDSRRHIQNADGHEFIKTACFNYLRIKDFEDMLVVDLRVSEQFDSTSKESELVADHPWLKYAVQYLFPHAAQAEKLGISQESFRVDVCSNVRGFFERWKCLHDIVPANWTDIQGPEARPIHVFARYGLLTREIAQNERNIDIVGGRYCSALVAACWGGHQDAVRILLEFGADPRFDATAYGFDGDCTWYTTMAPLVCAVCNKDFPVLRQLLNDQRSPLTLEERLHLFFASIEDLRPYSKAFLDLLFPEATFPDSALDDLCQAEFDYIPEVFSFLVDKFENSIVHEEQLWQCALSSISSEGENVRALLDRGGRVKITANTIRCLEPYDSKALSLALEYCEAEMTEDLIDLIAQSADSLPILRKLEAAGHRLGPFTPNQLLWALHYASAETVAFFLQRRDDNMDANEMLDSALDNGHHGEEVTRLLLGYLNPDHIIEQAIIAALRNDKCGGDLIRLLHSRWSSLTFSEAALATAVDCQQIDIIRFVLERCECVRVTEEILSVAGHRSRAGVVDLLLLHDPCIRVQESTVIQTFCNRMEVVEILAMFCRHGKHLWCTENVVAAAANSSRGAMGLEIILQRDRGAKISSSMIMMAMRAECGAALICVMLCHDPTLVIEEHHLIAAAANPRDPSTLFDFLKTKGKLANDNPASEILNTGPAKRRRVSHKSLPCISNEVINAAFSNPKEGARLRLLDLFVEWGVISATDYNNMLEYRSQCGHKLNVTTLP